MSQPWAYGIQNKEVYATLYLQAVEPIACSRSVVKEMPVQPWTKKELLDDTVRVTKGMVIKSCWAMQCV